ncbi:MAG: aldo/keto reductase [Pseudomonadota bacterium]
MKMNRLGRTDIEVSALCLGTMTWGTQNTANDACDQIARCEEAGLNFMDTAEMYPVTPISAETQGDTERCIGEWVKRGGNRDKWVIATKVSGAGLRHVRGGEPISPTTMDAALEQSLKSMNTDYVDLYQLHWPNRGSYMFRQNWNYDPTKQDKAEALTHMEAVLDWAEARIKEGKIRAIGLSNESCWGIMNWVRLAEDKGLPRVASVQNEYSMLCRMFDTDMAEMTHHEDVGLLSFSPLATGYLTGKYQNGNVPAGSRRDIQAHRDQRGTERCFEAVDAYQALADKHGLNLAQMSLAFCMQRPFMTSTIFGATKMDQLEEILGAKDLVLSDEVMAEINQVHQRIPYPF